MTYREMERYTPSLETLYRLVGNFNADSAERVLLDVSPKGKGDFVANIVVFRSARCHRKEFSSIEFTPVVFMQTLIFFECKPIDVARGTHICSVSPLLLILLHFTSGALLI